MATNPKDTLVSLKRPASGPESMKMAMKPEGENYGYGTCLRLENFELDALKLALPQAGKEFTITAKGIVTDVATRDEGEGDVDRAVTIQITDLALR